VLACLYQDHPRARGEYECFAEQVGAGLGSPPSARGIPTHPGGSEGRRGITPERAGNTDSQLHAHAAPPDHPRARGEYAIGRRVEATIDGSPPSARGILTDRHELQIVGRITPERAGNTWCSSIDLGGGPDHPRARGEYPLASSGGATPDGITPERAGNT